MQVFITGISGFVGAHLAKALVERGAEVTGLQHDIKKTSYLDLLDIKDKVNIVTGDITDVNLLYRVLVDYEIDHVFHLAAQPIVRKAIQYPMYTYKTNIFGTVSLLEACRLISKTLKAIIVISTDKVYGDKQEAKEEHSLNGLGIYDSSKVCMDIISRAYHRQYNLPIVVARACNIYGYDLLNERIVPSTLKALLKKEPPLIFEGEDTYREYIYVGDVCDAYTSLAEKIEQTKGQAYNIGTGEVISQEDMVLKIVQTWNAIYGTNVKPKYVKRDNTVKEITKQSLNSAKIKKIGWNPKVSLDEGLRKVILESRGALK